jgi:hypothetical protein
MSRSVARSQAAFYVVGWLCIAFGLLLLKPSFGGSETAPLAYSLIVLTGLTFLIIGGTLGQSHRLLAIASLVAITAMSVTLLLVVTEKPPPCADDITETRALGFLRPWLQEVGYSQNDIESFRMTALSNLSDDAWPWHGFHFTGTKRGETVGVLGVGNGCGIGELQEAEPFKITKIR